MPFIYSLSGLYTDERGMGGLVDVVLVELRSLTASEIFASGIFASEISSFRFTWDITRNFLKFCSNCHYH